MNRIVTGKRPLTHQEIKIFANLFDVSTDYLLGLTDNPLPLKSVTVTGQEFYLTTEKIKLVKELKNTLSSFMILTLIQKEK
jgi:hypothetical protein